MPPARVPASLADDSVAVSVVADILGERLLLGIILVGLAARGDPSVSLLRTDSLKTT